MKAFHVSEEELTNLVAAARAGDLEAVVLWRGGVDDIRKLWAPPFVPE